MPGDVRDAIAAGMARQRARVRAAEAAGAPRLGWKVAINDPAMQRALGLDGPLVAALDGAARLASGARWTVAPGVAMAAEAEIAIVLGRDVVPDGGLAAAGRAIAALAPAIELVDHARPAGDLAAMLSHSVFHAATVLGTPRHGAAPPPPPWPVLAIAGRPGVAAEASLAPGPLDALVLRCARFLAEHGERLLAGDCIISGSFVPPQHAAAGDRVTADFGPLGTVAVELAA